jgi:hypothetical protein
MQAARNGIGLIALTLGIIACGDATQPTSPGPAPYAEGAKVSMTGTSTISIPGLNGQVVSATTHEWATDAIVTDGLAQVARSQTIQNPSASPKMPVVYVSDKHVLARGPRNNRQIIPGGAKDSKGNGGEFVLITGNTGPVKTMAHIGANRQIDQAYSFEWKKVGGGWLATAFTVSLFKNGKALGQIRSATKLGPRGPSLMVAEPDYACWDSPTCDPVLVDMGIPGGTFGGSYYYTPSCCQLLLDAYYVAATGFAGAWLMCSDAGALLSAGCILTLGSLGGAVALTLLAYNTCFQNSPCAKTIVTCPWPMTYNQCYAEFKVPDPPGFLKLSDPFRPSGMAA